MKAQIRTATRRFPPVLVGGLTIMWLLLNQTVDAAQVVLGLALAAALTWASATLRPLQPHLHRADTAVALIAIVLYDIVRSNISAARIVLGLVRDRKIRSGFVRVPLTLKDPHGLAVLACIVTATPGTVWVDLDEQTNTLTLHVLDLRPEQEWPTWIESRYERRLRRIFE